MGIRKVPFASLRRLNDLVDSEWANRFEDTWVRDVVYPGWKRHFTDPNPKVKVWEDLDFEESDVEYVDVHVGLTDSEGNTHQPWLLTFVTRNYAERRPESSIGFKELSNLDNPFPDEEVIWDCDKFSEEEVLSAMGAWAKRFWPDWDPEFVFEMEFDSLEWLSELVRDALFSNPDEMPQALQDFVDAKVYRISLSPGTQVSVESWLADRDQKPLSVTEDGFLLRCLPSLIAQMEALWPNSITCSLAFSDD